MKISLLFQIIILWLFSIFTLNAAAPVLKITKCTKNPIVDGHLNDLAWKDAAIFDNFKTLQPDYGLPPSEKTIAYLTYNEESLFFAIHCFDREPEKIKATVSARDQGNGDDWVAFCIDSDNDELASFFFMSNPLGIQADGTLDAAANPDIQLDMVWESAGRRTHDGYIVEMEIPLRNLRFPQKDSLVMGFKVARFISRKSEEVDYPEYLPSRGAALSQFQKISLSNIKGTKIFELIPSYTMARTDHHHKGQLTPGNWVSNFGITSKIGLTSGITLDATYNPDFSQVETDAGQIDVNLRAALFYPERRPFFQEGQEWLGFSARPDGTYLREIVNTRSIVDPILGLKVSGKLGRKNLISSLYAIDEFPRSEAADLSNKNAHFSVFRYARLLGEDSYLGFFGTAWHLENKHNYLSGLDGRIRTGKQSRVEFHGFRSYSKEENLFSSGQAMGGSWHIDSRKWNFRLGLFDISKDFDTKLGYYTRRGLFTVPVFMARNFFFKHKNILRLSPYYWSRHSLDHYSKRWESFNVLGLELALSRQTQLSISTWIANEIFADQIFSRNAIRMELGTQPLNWLRLDFGWRRGRGILYDIAQASSGRETEFGIGMRLQPTSKFTSEFRLSHAHFYKKNRSDKLYNINILRNISIMQFNKYLFFRSIIEYNTFHKHLSGNILLSFTWIPGTVIHLGYGSQFEKREWNETVYVPSEKFLNTQKAWFFKASYRWQK